MYHRLSSVFPSFLDVAGLIDQDFSMMLADEVSQRFLAKWSTVFKTKVLADCKTLPQKQNIDELLSGTEPQPDDSCGWGSDTSSNLLLLHLLPLTSRGQEKNGKDQIVKQPTIFSDILRYAKEGASVTPFRDLTQDKHFSCASVSEGDIQRFYMIDQKPVPCKIVNIPVVFSYTITDGMMLYLKHLISDHHTRYKALLPGKKLIPKHGLMIHYPRCIHKIGPLIHTWCICFEAKHNSFKRCG
ncbi:uncharacterized protein LOC129174356 [Dunckerocampus dactyliophorus]|uniref:uncharacterized protein LOC129174356 n=1 Tax=Dunckerocampus dactyliophorus TaxID=161453 RepID=UPI0024063BB8|nr:uncharacterized protein LOC129174356 [Dunckerocampus dactyliophorus]